MQSRRAAYQDEFAAGPGYGYVDAPPVAEEVAYASGVTRAITIGAIGLIVLGDGSLGDVVGSGIGVDRVAAHKADYHRVLVAALELIGRVHFQICISTSISVMALVTPVA